MRNVYLILAALIVRCLISADCYAIEFNNFSHRVNLTPVSDGHYLLPDNIKVKLTNRIVIKAAAAVTKEQIKSVDPRVTTVQVLYRFANAAYYGIGFDAPKDLDAVLNRFAALPCVVSAQPDLLQLSEKTARPGLVQRRIEYLDHIEKLNINSLWRKTRGEAVKIAIIDDGFDLDHEDLKGVNLSFGYDVETGTLNPSPANIVDNHGTRVAGVIFAQHNHTGIDGIAPNAGLIAIRHPDTWTSKTILSFYLAKIAGADVINCSWKSKVLLEPLADVIHDLTTTGRNGKGLVLVFAAGNKGIILEKNTCEATLPRVIAVGATDLRGRRLPFSNYGTNVYIFTYGKNILAPARGPRKYTGFSGTSASSAIVSGVAALLLSQHREMTLAAIHQQLDSIFGHR